MTRRTFFLSLLGAPLLPLSTASTAAAMDTAKMQAVAQAITNAGYDAVLNKQGDGSWRVRARSAAMDIPVASANNLAVAQAVSCVISEAEFF